MPEILPNHAPSPRTPLVWDGTAYRAVRGHTDGTVQVRGEDQLFSFKGVVAEWRSLLLVGADGYIESTAVPGGECWIITTVSGTDAARAFTRASITNLHDGVPVTLRSEDKAFGVAEHANWSGHTYLDVGDRIRMYFTGGQNNDSCTISITGYRMTVET